MHKGESKGQGASGGAADASVEVASYIVSVVQFLKLARIICCRRASVAASTEAVAGGRRGHSTQAEKRYKQGQL